MKLCWDALKIENGPIASHKLCGKLNSFQALAKFGYKGGFVFTIMCQ